MEQKKISSKDLAWLIRRHSVEMTHLSKGSHIASVLSVADIIAVLYAQIMHYRVNDPLWDNRDRMILSKGHAGAAIYAALAECGFFDVQELKSHYQDGSRLSGHVSHHVPGVDFSTGSLGHGLSVATGIAYAAAKSGKTFKTYAVLGDGECDEGSVWEAAMFANQFHLSNLIAIVDYNKMQSMDFCEKTISLDPLTDKWKSFGWNVTRVDGNNHRQLAEALSQHGDKPAPTMIIADTLKGYGIPFMQNDILWHYRFPHEGWEYDAAVAELHRIKPDSVEDPYTPAGVAYPTIPPDADIYNDHTTSATWKPSSFKLNDTDL